MDKNGIEAVKSFIEEEIGFDWDKLPKPEGTFLEIAPDLIGSAVAFKEAHASSGEDFYSKYFVGDGATFHELAPQGFFVVGYWGYGTNSYAVYLMLADSWRSLYFRLYYGGAYGDIDRDAKRIRDILKAYTEFESKIKKHVKSIVFASSMGEIYCKVQTKNGTVIEPWAIDKIQSVKVPWEHNKENTIEEELFTHILGKTGITVE